ncbi:MAG: DMT family transporter [Holophagales bacterium]|jgi:drug/metabolite transporter (DMT)-like permease|nr:DMT family transporter [Holophagales bacterium]
MKRYAPAYAGITYSTIFGFSFLASKSALEKLDIFELLFLRFALATLLFLLLAACKIIKLSYRGKPLRQLVLVCLFQPILYFTFETFGIRECSTSTAGLMLGAIPVTVAFLAWLALDEKPTWIRTISLLISLCGVGFIALSTSGGENTFFGLLLLFGAMASASLYNVFSRKSSRVFTPMETTFVMMVSGTLTFGALALFKGAPDLFQRAAQVLPNIAYLGGLSSVVAFFLVNFNLSRLSASQASVFSNLSTAVSVAAGVIFRGEHFGLLQATGALLILLGVWGANRNGAGIAPGYGFDPNSK